VPPDGSRHLALDTEAAVATRRRQRRPHVSYAFWHGEASRPEVFGLRDEDMSSLNLGFPRWGSSAVGRGAAWASRWGRDQLKGELERCLKARTFGASGLPALDRRADLGCLKLLRMRRIW
jgi:hypothetical protein